MRIILFNFLIITPFFLFSQTSNKFLVGSSFGLNSGYSKHFNMKPLLLYKSYCGIQFFDKLDVLLEIGFMNHQQVRFGAKNMQTFSLDANVNYRFFKNAVVSPKVSFSGGFYPYTNLKNQEVYGDNLVIASQGSGDYTFSSWGPFFDLQVFVSIKMKQFYLDLGGGIPYYNYKLSTSPPYNSILVNGFGTCFTGKLSYSIPLKKKVE